jgi:hypothetical protein
MKSWVFCAGVLLICGASSGRVARAFGVGDKASATSSAATASPTATAATTATTGTASSGDATSKDPKTGVSADSAADGQPASTANTPGSDAAPAPAPAAAAPADSTPADIRREWSPMPAESGNPGMFTVETGETLPRGGFAFTAGADKFSRDPGNITVVSYGWAFAAGITNRISAFVNLDAYNHVHVGRPDLLSLSANTIGNPQFGNTIYRTIVPLPGAAPAYVEDFPFAAQSGGGVGEVDLGFKINLLSEKRGGPFSLSIKNDFYIPTQTSLGDLLSNGSQNGRFNYGVGAEASKSIFHGSIVAALNGEYRLTLDPSFTVAGANETVQLADQVNLGAGFLFFPQKRFQIISEYTATIFVGTHTQNTTFGPRDPVAQVSGIRFYFWRNLAIDVAYRYMVDLTNHKDRNGFVLKFDTARWPSSQASSKASNDVITATCSADKTSLRAGSGDRIVASTLAKDSLNLPLNYSWSANGGRLEQSGPSARWDATGLAAGTYTITARVDAGPRGVPATCSVNVAVQ